MADQLPINFPLPGEPILASFDWVDVADGVGYVRYYLANMEDTDGKDYIMTRSQIYSTDIFINPPTGGATTTYTFYSPVFINRPRIMKGVLHFNFCYGYIQSGAPPGQMDFTFKVYHYDGTTSTQLGSTWESPTILAGAASATTILNGQVEIATNQKFAIGDQIKIEFAATAVGGTSMNADNEVGIDPQNRDANFHLTPSTNNAEFTQFTLDVPFKVVE